jgi:hypothetical protein
MFLWDEFASASEQASMRVSIVDLRLHGFEILIFLIGAKHGPSIVECFFDGGLSVLEYLHFSEDPSIE